MKDLNLGSHYEMLKNRDGITKFTMVKSPKEADLHGDFTDFNKEGENNNGDEDEDEDDLYLEEINRKDSKKWWKKRMQRYEQLYLPSNYNRNIQESDDLNRVGENNQ